MPESSDKPLEHFMFPWRAGNSFCLLVDGSEYFPRMLQAIQHARSMIMLEMYLFESGHIANHFIEALLTAAERGVSIYIIMDDFGSRGLSHYDKSRLRHPNIELRYYNPFRLRRFFHYFLRDHRKILIIDNYVAYTGGAGLTDEFLPPDDPSRQWHDCMIEIQGSNVADWSQLFLDVWQSCTRGLAAEIPIEETAAVEGAQGRVVRSNGLISREIMHSLVKRIRSAEHRVWFELAYFVPSWKLRRSLRYVARKGVDVRLVLPGHLTDHPAVRLASHRYFSELLATGIRIFEYQPRVLHSKVILCDQWCSIGSSNLDRWNLRWNLEANQETDNQEFAEIVCAMFETDFEQCEEIKPETWHLRPWYKRLREHFWGTIDSRFIDRIRRRFRHK
jgi:phosphatidylserine/phosphatidylglycerophosphate/cardiolipin synthase-like enzyme